MTFSITQEPIHYSEVESSVGFIYYLRASISDESYREPFDKSITYCRDLHLESRLRRMMLCERALQPTIAAYDARRARQTDIRPTDRDRSEPAWARPGLIDDAKIQKVVDREITSLGRVRPGRERHVVAEMIRQQDSRITHFWSWNSSALLCMFITYSHATRPPASL